MDILIWLALLAILIWLTLLGILVWLTLEGILILANAVRNCDLADIGCWLLAVLK
jgi:hypothetical protein